MDLQHFMAGVGRVNITPPLSAPHAGWGAQVHVFPDGVEADLWATVLVVSDGIEVAAFVDLDLVIISRAESDAIRAEVASVLGIPATSVRVSVTHNHAGPPPSSWDWMDAGRHALQGYYALLPAWAAGAARLAHNSMRPARLGVAVGESRVSVNRRETAPDGRTVTGTNLEGPTDPHVLVIRVDAVEGEPIAAIVGYTMHPTTLGPANRLLSPDWPGHLKRTVEMLTGATCLFVQGATGDIGPGPDGYTDDVQVVRRLGTAVGCEAVRVYLGLHVPPVEYQHERVWDSGAPLGKWTAIARPQPMPRVRSLSREVALPVRTQPSLEDARIAVEHAQAFLNQLVERRAPAAEIEAATFQVKRANMTLTRVTTFGEQDTFPIELHLLQLGPVVLAGAECEPFSQIGLSVKHASPFDFTWFGGYTGGWFGYVPTADEFPRQGYEVETSPYTVEAAERLCTETTAVLRELADGV